MKKYQFGVVGLLAGIAILYSCTQKVESKPNYIFKKNPNKEIVAKVKGEEIKRSEMRKGIESKIYKKEKELFELKMNRLQAVIMQKLMDQDPKKKGLSNDEYLEKYIVGDYEPSKKEIDAFVEKKGIPKDRLNAQLKDRIKKFLVMEKKKQLVDEWIAKKTQDNPVEVYLDKPERPEFEVKLSGDAPQWGSDDADVTIVEFSDFQCPFCQKGAKIMDKVKNNYDKDEVRIVFKNYPLPFHKDAKLAAKAGLCSNEQGSKKFWKMHDKMFADQQGLKRDDLISKAKNVGLKMNEFKECLESPEIAQRIESDIQQGKELGINSTPTFFVNGKLVNGAHPFETFKEIIDDELE